MPPSREGAPHDLRRHQGKACQGKGARRQVGGKNEQSRGTKAEAEQRAEALRPITELANQDMSANAIAIELNPWDLMLLDAALMERDSQVGKAREEEQRKQLNRPENFD